MVDRYLEAKYGRCEEHGEVVDVTTKGNMGITARKLSDLWADVVGTIQRHGLEVANANHAMEGARTIRYVTPSDVPRK